MSESEVKQLENESINFLSFITTELLELLEEIKEEFEDILAVN